MSSPRVVEEVVFDEAEGVLVAHVRPRKGATRRCGRCGRRCAWEDRGEGRRRWRSLDLGFVPAYLEADAPRVRCPEHGVTVVAFPWARHRARHTSAFEDQCAWLAAHCSRSAVEELLRVAWRTMGSIVGRVVADAHARRDPIRQCDAQFNQWANRVIAASPFNRMTRRSSSLSR